MSLPNPRRAVVTLNPLLTGVAESHCKINIMEGVGVIFGKDGLSQAVTELRNSKLKSKLIKQCHFLKLYFIVYAIKVVPASCPLPSSTQPAPQGSPHTCPCPWVTHVPYFAVYNALLCIMRSLVFGPNFEEKIFHLNFLIQLFIYSHLYFIETKSINVFQGILHTAVVIAF